MDFLGLKMVVICLFLAGCSAQEVHNYTFLKYEIGNPIPRDTLEVIVKGDTYCIGYEMINGINCFEIDDYQESLRLKPAHCEAETLIALKIGEASDIGCEPVFPFVGERVTILDKKVFSTSGTEYTVFKLYNEIGASDLKSSTLFWVQNHGVAMIKLGAGEYFVVEDWKTDLIKEVKEDLNFSELWPIPAAPPPPVFED